MMRSRALPLVFSALLPAACADFEPARRSERAYDSPYANPQGNDVTCEGDTYLVGQRCVSASDLLDASAPRADAAVDAGTDAAQLGADAASDAAELDAAADAARDSAADAARDGAPDARDDAGDSSAEAGIPAASDAQTDASEAAPEGGS